MEYHDIRRDKIRELTPVEAYILGVKRSMEFYTDQGLTQKQAHHRLLQLGEWINEETGRLAQKRRRERQLVAEAA